MSNATKKTASDTSSSLRDDRAPGTNGAHPIEEQIRLRAYELYVERGAEPNDDLGDWLRAERELRMRVAAEIPGPPS